MTHPEIEAANRIDIEINAFDGNDEDWAKRVISVARAELAALDCLKGARQASEQTHVAKDAPVMIAWKLYKKEPDFENTKRWACEKQHTEGSLWAAYENGFRAGSFAAANVIREFAETQSARIVELENVLEEIWLWLAPGEAEIPDVARMRLNIGGRIMRALSKKEPHP